MGCIVLGMTQSLTTPVTAAALTAARTTDAAVVKADGTVLIPAGRIEFTAGSYEHDWDYLAEKLNQA
jgi:hypothetical protein